MKYKYLFLGVFLLLIVLALAACQSQAPAATEPPVQQAQPTVAPCPTAAPCPECPTCPPQPVVQEVPFADLWANSGHANADAEAFNHWNDEGQIPESCAKCHSTPGYQDFVGADGSEAGVVNQPAPTGTVITCVACHNSATATLSAVTFPSGVEITGLGPSARCMICHQGRASTVQVNDAITEAGVADEDTPSPDLGFINVHYFAAGATLYGSDVHGGYEFEGRTYVPKNKHVEGYDTCDSCHSPHSLEVQVDQCAVCHDGVTSVDDLKNVRMNDSLVDFDGDGNIEEGLYYEIDGLREQLLASIQAYASEVAGTPIAYTPDSHPYFFVDTNNNGEVDTDEANGDNAYNAFTPRLLKAAYNYQYVVKDPGNFAHNGGYIIELLYDSIDELNAKLTTPAVDVTTLHRDKPGHFDATAEAFRHWDEEETGLVPATCSKCHTAEGLPFLLETGGTAAFPPGNGLACKTCHTSLETFELRQSPEVTFPSGAVLSFGEDGMASNLCINCHQGRESTVSINAAIDQAGVGADEVSPDLSFRNPHYFAAGATLFGGEANGAYEYEGKDYVGKLTHVPAFDTCTECHNAHALNVRIDQCSACHGTINSPEDLRKIRLDPTGTPIDYDGDGNVTEGIAMEIETMHDALYKAIQDYAASTTDAEPIIFNGDRYPYWFADTNNNGEVDGDEGAYNTWTPNLLRAAYNYTWVAKDPGAFAHNSNYVMQFLYDSIESIGGDVSAMTRPTTPAAPATTPTATP